MTDQEMKDMLVEYMGKGFLENIVALFRQDMTLSRFTADMMGAEEIRVRLGATALVEELSRERREDLETAVPGLIALLSHENPTIRGDAASALGIIRTRAAEEALERLLADEHPGVREVARDALEEIRKDER